MKPCYGELKELSTYAILVNKLITLEPNTQGEEYLQLTVIAYNTYMTNGD